LESNASDEFVGFLSSLAGDTKLLSDSLSEFLFGDHKLLFNILLNNIFLEELLECFGHLTL